MQNQAFFQGKSTQFLTAVPQIRRIAAGQQHLVVPQQVHIKILLFRLLIFAVQFALEFAQRLVDAVESCNLAQNRGLFQLAVALQRSFNQPQPGIFFPAVFRQHRVVLRDVGAVHQLQPAAHRHQVLVNAVVQLCAQISHQVGGLFARQNALDGLVPAFIQIAVDFLRVQVLLADRAAVFDEFSLHFLQKVVPQLPLVVFYALQPSGNHGTPFENQVLSD